MSRGLCLLPRWHQPAFRGLNIFSSSTRTIPKALQSPSPTNRPCIFCHHHHQLLSSRPSVFHQSKYNAGKQQDGSERFKSSVVETETVGQQMVSWQQPLGWTTPFVLPEPQLDWDYLCAAANRHFIQDSIDNRKGLGNIDRLHQLWDRHQSAVSQEEKESLWKELLAEGLNIPNSSHRQSPIGEESNARIVEVHSQKREFDFKPKSVIELGEQLQMLRTDNLNLVTGPRTYYFQGQLARLEQALVRFALSKLKDKGFELLSVPDLLQPEVIDSCGFNTQGERTQVYRLDKQNGQVCLAGTAEMSLAGFFMNDVLDYRHLPKKVAAVSRCYRAETSDIAAEKGIYRVHQFTKVEMFGLTADEGIDESGQLLQHFVDIEQELFATLGLCFRVLDMPTEELGAPAHRKYDIETWMPAHGFWGEISSASNCTDFQSRRLNIAYRDPSGNVKFVHTVNGTACAVPRTIMALVENCQQEDGSVLLPSTLQPWLGTTHLTPPAHKDLFIRYRTQDQRKR